MDTSVHQIKPHDEDCKGPNCGQCLKGGMPMRKDALSLLLVLFIVMTTIMGVLYINAKRELKAGARTQGGTVSEQPKTATTYPTAAARTFTSVIPLPKPIVDGKFSLDRAIATRRSRREFSAAPVTLSQISQMAWSGQGQTDPTGKRTAPSARESYSMTIFVFVKQAQGIEPGIYEYLPATHSLGALAPIDVTSAMTTAGVQEGAVNAPVVFLIASDFGVYQTKTKSSEVTPTYMEAGHIGQNMYLEAESLGMATVTMAGFDSAKVTTAVNLDPAFKIEYLMPFGHRADAALDEEAKEVLGKE